MQRHGSGTGPGCVAHDQHLKLQKAVTEDRASRATKRSCSNKHMGQSHICTHTHTQAHKHTYTHAPPITDTQAIHTHTHTHAHTKTHTHMRLPSHTTISSEKSRHCEHPMHISFPASYISSHIVQPIYVCLRRKTTTWTSFYASFIFKK
jgi:hypothetical protein